ncbi:proline dehydrogenase family protein [Flavobacteriaceae bacterium]|nr:proline dehydrogenase family protein [Flavobacteriaceae bacterium]
MRFEDTKTAYSLKTDRELYKAYLLFKIFSKKLLVQVGGKLTLLLIRFGLPLNAFFKKTVFFQFCAGDNENDALKRVDSLSKLNVSSYMHYAAEDQKTERGMDESMKRVLKIFSISKSNESLPFTVFKPTAFGPVNLFQKKAKGEQLNQEESMAWDRAIDRINRCCEYVKKEGVRLLIDAEESWLQNAIDMIALELMRKYNTTKTPLIFNTTQMCRKDRLPYLESLIYTAKKEGFQIGIKLVRGAYMETEQKRALEKGYPSPICDSKNATDQNFNAALELLLSNLDQCELFLGSHNEESILKVVHWMKEKELPANYSKIWFSQLYGMADHISFNLAAAGYQVVKYLPYGPIKEVIPYLIRRAEENTSIHGQTPRELKLIKKELKRRKAKVN